MTNAYLIQNRLSILLAALLFSTINTGTTAAQECYSDDDCDGNEHCDLPPSGRICEHVEGEEPVCETVEGGPGRCEFGPGSCQKDADCGEGYICNVRTVYATGDTECSEDGSCPTPEPTYVEGWCEPAPLECEVDSDCPSPLSCAVFIEEDCSLDGEEEVCEAEQVTLCSYEPIECERDADCDAGYECALVDSGEMCTSSDMAGPGCLPGEPCEPMPPEPIDEECETIQEQYCFPKRVDCESDRDCSNGWKCLDFSETYELSDAYEDGEYGGPPWWQQEGESKAIACMPEGLVAIFNGQVSWERQSDDKGESEDATAPKSGSLSDPRDTDESAGDADEDESSTEGMGACGCSVTPEPHGTAYALALTALLLVFRRKRRARR